MSKERKKYGIRATKKPAKADLVASTVRVRNESGEYGYCYIGFNPEFVDAIGMKLPRGVSKESPACVEVVYYAPTKVWLVKARYVREPGEVLLWKTESKPSWLSFYRGKNGNPDSQKAGTKAGSRNPAGEQGLAAREAPSNLGSATSGPQPGGRHRRGSVE